MVRYVNIFALIFAIKGCLIDSILGDFQRWDCSLNQFERCRHGIESALMGSKGSASILTQRENCRQLRQDMNCLLFYSTNCLFMGARLDLQGVLLEVRGFLARFCESEDKVDENWTEKPCYRNDQVERCDDRYARARYGSGYGSNCIKYEEYKNCINGAVENQQCDQNEKLFVGSHLMDRTYNLSWTCESPQFRGGNSISRGYIQDMNQTVNCILKIQPDVNLCTRKDVVYEGQVCCHYADQLKCIRDSATQKCGLYVDVEKAFRRKEKRAECDSGYETGSDFGVYPCNGSPAIKRTISHLFFLLVFCWFIRKKLELKLI